MKEEENSEAIRQRVNAARSKQRNRYKEYNIFSNSELTAKQIEEFCILNSESKDILEKYFEKLKLSARSYSRILKVSRTIADLEGFENINKNHILEAISLSKNVDMRN